MGTKPKALFLTAESPYPVVGGGALRSASILEYLLTRYETDVICFRQPGEPSLALPDRLRETGNLRHWRPLVLPTHGKSSLQRGFRNVSRAIRGVPPLVDRFSGFAAAVQQATQGQFYDAGIVEHFWCAQYVDPLRACCRTLALDLHNVESLWHERCAAVGSAWVAPMHRHFARAATRLENTFIPRFHLVLATSELERNFVAKRFRDLRVEVVPNSIPWRERPRPAPDGTIVFSGNMEYLPNRKAIQYFAHAIWPLILQQQPRLHWKILGKAAAQMASLVRGCPQVQLLTDPDDAMMEIAKSLVAVVPLTIGTGTRLKIVEAWAAGCPVVSTPLGAEGLACEPGADILIEEAPARFARAVSRIVEDRAFARELAEAGRTRFETSYTWDSAWKVLRNCGL